MSSGIHQVLVTYELVEDRLLLKVSTQDAREFRAWITRRYLSHLWNTLTQTIEVDSIKTDGTQVTKNTQLQAKFQESVQKANRTEQYQHKSETITYPLGEQPILLERIITSTTASGNHRVQLMPAKGQGIDLNLNVALIAPIIQMLYEAEQKADWQLHLKLPGQIKAKEALPALLS